MRRRRVAFLCVVAALAAVTPACGSGDGPRTGDIQIDGSSTVYLISEAVAAAFKRDFPSVNITVGLSGTGGGFKRFANGQTDIQDASRPITPAEASQCVRNGVAYAEFQIAWDGVAVVVNQANDWATRMTVAQLRRIWQPENRVTTWKQVEPRWPDERIELFGPGPDSGTFDFFSEDINGTARLTRRDYNASGDPQTMVEGVMRNKYALAYFGLAYYEANAGKLRDVAIAATNGDYIKPTQATVLSGQYPLSRPLFIYVNVGSLARADVREFCRFYLRRTDLVRDVGYIPLTTLEHARQRKALESWIKAGMH